MNNLNSYFYSSSYSSYSGYNNYSGYSRYGYNGYGYNGYGYTGLGGYSTPNYAPGAPDFVYTASMVRGEVKAGDIIAVARSFDSNGDRLSYHLADNQAGYYTINSKTGYIALTSAGAQAMNNGRELPAIRVFAYDGKTTGALSELHFSDPEPVPVNHAPETPSLTASPAEFVKGTARTGDVVAKATSSDVDGDDIRFYLVDNTSKAYTINTKTGEVSLTSVGAAIVNAGRDLPDVKVVAYDGEATSPVSVLDVANTTIDVVELNHAPTAPVLVDGTSIVAGKATAGTIIAKVQSTDIDGDKVNYHLLKNDGSYEINTATGEVRLTAQGANAVNSGKALPDITVVTNDGKEWGFASTIKVEVTKPTWIPTEPTGISDPVSPVVGTNPSPIANSFRVDTTFHDSRDLSKVNTPYFLKILETDKSGYLWKTWQGPGKGANIAYEFATSASDSGVGYSFTVRGFQRYTETQKQAVRDALDLYEQQTNLKFTEVSSARGQKANFKFYLDDLTVENTYANNHRNFGDENGYNPVQQGYRCGCPSCSQQNVEGLPTGGEKGNATFVAGYAYFGGDVHMNSTKFGGNTDMSIDTKIIETSDGRSISWISGGFGTLIHEIGHSVGLAHPFDGKYSITQNSAEDKSHLTMMSYSNDIKEDVVLSNGYKVNTTVSTTNFGIFDLASLHYRYGVNEAQHAGDSTYTFKEFNRESLGNDIYIWDGSGNDTFDGSAETKSLHIDLTPGSWIYRGEEKANTLVYDSRGKVVGDQMFIGFGTQIENLIGGKGSDYLTGNETNNHIQGGAGHDHIDGGKGHDWLEGGAGNDEIRGAEGNDILVGGLGQDTLIGGAGKDQFTFDNIAKGSVDYIKDFNQAEGDTIVLMSNVFTSLKAGILSSEYFQSGAGAKAKDANDFLIFDTTSNNLYYDADGNGAGEAVAIAHFNPYTQLDNQHIQIV